MQTITVVSRYVQAGWFGREGGRRIESEGLEIDYAVSRDTVEGTVNYKAVYNGIRGILTIPQSINNEGPTQGVATFTEE